MIYAMNADKGLVDSLAHKIDITNFKSDTIEKDDIDGVFVNWVNDNAEQATVVDFCANNKKPIIIFDSNIKLKEKEYNWLKKHTRTKFYEPAIKNRQGFSCMQLIKILGWKDFGFLENPPERKYDLYHKGNIHDRYKPFEAYYKKISNDYPDIKAYYDDNGIDKKKKEKYDGSYLTYTKNVEWKDVKCTILIGNYKDYVIGRLDNNLFDIMKNGCIPLLPKEHRFFHCIFDGLVIKNYHYIEYFVMNIDKVREVVMVDVFNDIERYYPELTLNYAVERISDFFKKG